MKKFTLLFIILILFFSCTFNGNRFDSTSNINVNSIDNVNNYKTSVGSNNLLKMGKVWSKIASGKRRIIARRKTSDKKKKTDAKNLSKYQFYLNGERIRPYLYPIYGSDRNMMPGDLISFGLRRKTYFCKLKYPGKYRFKTNSKEKLFLSINGMSSKISKITSTEEANSSYCYLLKNRADYKFMDLPSEVEELTEIKSLNSIIFISMCFSPLEKLPTGKLPNLKKIVAHASKLTKEEVDRFRKINPQCQVFYTRNQALQYFIKNSDKIEFYDNSKIRTSNAAWFRYHECYPKKSDRKAKLLKTITDVDKVENIVKNLVLIENDSIIESTGEYGIPTLKFYENDNLMAEIDLMGGWIQWINGEIRCGVEQTKESEEFFRVVYKNRERDWR